MINTSGFLGSGRRPNVAGWIIVVHHLSHSNPGHQLLLPEIITSGLQEFGFTADSHIAGVQVTGCAIVLIMFIHPRIGFGLLVVMFLLTVTGITAWRLAVFYLPRLLSVLR